MVIYPPCKDCTEREAGCHSKCDKYKKYRIELDEYNNRVEKEKKNFDSITSYHIETSRKVKMNLGRKRKKR